MSTALQFCSDPSDTKTLRSISSTSRCNTRTGTDAAHVVAQKCFMYLLDIFELVYCCTCSTFRQASQVRPLRPRQTHTRTKKKQKTKNKQKKPSKSMLLQSAHSSTLLISNSAFYPHLHLPPPPPPANALPTPPHDQQPPYFLTDFPATNSKPLPP